jgi:hypothetical protein
MAQAVDKSKKDVDVPSSEKIKAHFQRNKDRYLFFALGAVVVLAIRKPITIAPVFNNVPVFSNTNMVNNGGHMRKLVYCKELDKYFRSVTDTAEFAGVQLPMMSKHLNKKPGYDSVKGLHYEIAGLGTG